MHTWKGEVSKAPIGFRNPSLIGAKMCTVDPVLTHASEREELVNSNQLSYSGVKLAEVRGQSALETN